LNEKLQLGNLIVADLHQHAAAASAWVEALVPPWKGSIVSAISASGSAWGENAQIHALLASFERREQDWKIQRALAEEDMGIGQQQIRLAHDQLSVVTQEAAIAALQVDHGKQILDYYTTQ